jgi:DNA-binding XRE family transcriptional regulator
MPFHYRTFRRGFILHPYSFTDFYVFDQSSIFLFSVYIYFSKTYIDVCSLLCYNSACSLMALPQKKSKGRSYEAMLIGKQIRYLRRIKEISQQSLAKQVGVSEGWIGRIERGIFMPNIKLLVKLPEPYRCESKT